MFPVTVVAMKERRRLRLQENDEVTWAAGGMGQQVARRARYFLGGPLRPIYIHRLFARLAGSTHA